MSLPISPLTILGAARAARDVASSMIEKSSQAVGFDEVLQGVQPANPLASLGELSENVIARIRDALRQAGIGVNPPVDLAVQNNGSLAVVGDHERAAEIEAVLSNDRELNRLATQIHALGGPRSLRVASESQSLDEIGLPRQHG